MGFVWNGCGKCRYLTNRYCNTVLDSFIDQLFVQYLLAFFLRAASSQQPANTNDCLILLSSNLSHQTAAVGINCQFRTSRPRSSQLLRKARSSHRVLRVLQIIRKLVKVVPSPSTQQYKIIQKDVEIVQKHMTYNLACQLPGPSTLVPENPVLMNSVHVHDPQVMSKVPGSEFVVKKVKFCVSQNFLSRKQGVILALRRSGSHMFFFFFSAYKTDSPKEALSIDIYGFILGGCRLHCRTITH